MSVTRFFITTALYITATLITSNYLQSYYIGGAFLDSNIANAKIEHVILYSVIKLLISSIYLTYLKLSITDSIIITAAALVIRYIGGPFMFTILGISIIKIYSTQFLEGNT